MLDGFLFLVHLPQQTFVPYQSVLSLLHVYDVILVNSTDGVLLEIGGEDRYGSKQISSIYGLHILMRRSGGILPFVRRKAVGGGGCTQQVLIMCKVNIATGMS